MSITKVKISNSVRRTAEYAAYGRVKDAKKKPGNERTDLVTFSSLEGLNTVEDFIQKVESDTRSKGRKTECIHVMQSWSKDELDPDSEADQATAHLAGVELGQKLFPNSDFVIYTHLDSEGGCIHNHLVGSNDDLETGLAPRIPRNWHAVKRINDEVMRDLELEVCTPKKVRETNFEFWARNHREKVEEMGGEVSKAEAWAEAWPHEMRKRLSDALSDYRLAECESVDEALELLPSIAKNDYLVSVEVKKSSRRKPGIGLALVDEYGDERVYPKLRKDGTFFTGFCRIKGKNLGSAFGYDGIRESLAKFIEKRKQIQRSQERVNEELKRFDLKPFDLSPGRRDTGFDYGF